MGSAERELLRTGLRYALGLRLTIVALASLVSLLLEPAREPVLTAVVVVTLNAWNAWYAYRKVRDGGYGLIVADVAVMVAVSLTQVWTSGPGTTAESASWVLVAVSITVVSYPWQQGPVALAVSTVVLMAAYLTGAALARPNEWVAAAPVQLWMLVEAVLSYGLYRLVRHGARVADRLVARNEQIRREATIAAARRADEGEYLAALHDTASATLLMVGAGIVAKPERWLSEQAGRDLEVLRGREDVPAGEIDLLALLREVSSHTPLTVRWDVPDSLTVPAVVGITLSRGSREALTNVVRHAGVNKATVSARRDGDVVTVEISDEGGGFDAATVPENKYGVARSIIERMARIGGSAEVASRPGQGTRVRLSSPVVPQDSTGGDAELIAGRFLWGLRWAVLVMNLIILYGLDLPKVLASPDAYSSLAAQYVALGVFTLVSPLVAVTMLRGTTRMWWRWPLVVVIFGVSILATQTVLPEHRLGVPHWSEGDATWSLAALVLTENPVVYAGVIVGQYAMTFVQVALGGESAATFVGVVNATLNSLGYLLAVGMIAAVLKGIAVSAARIARDEEGLRTSEAVADQLHNDRKDRYAGIADTTVPLLSGLASGELDPGDPDVRRRCSLDAAKMRRLFAERASDPLLHELRGCIELAERNGVSVRFAERGQRPVVPSEARQVLTEPAVAMLARAVSVARVTLVGTGNSVTVSVVADCSDDTVPEVRREGVTSSTVRSGGQLWVEVTWMRGE